MTPAKWRTVEELFENALACPDEERATFLREHAGGDESIQREVEALLESHAGADGELEELVQGVAADWAGDGDSAGMAGQKLGRYEIVSPLASGGMGEVFLAQDTMLDRKVALKLLPRQFTRDRDRLRRFEQEARAASALNHPNIITIYEIGEVDGTRFIATEYVEGETLREVIAGPRRDISEILEIGCQAAGALAAAHGAGIVHRDVKPANIMLRADGFVKVLDFGLAKLTSTAPQLEVTDPGRVMGTINYMSPEQALGRPLDHRTDIFSLGVVLYELATGERLHDGRSEAAVYESILHKAPPPTGEFLAAAPVEFDDVIRHALAKDPAQRYQTAAEFRTDLKRLAEGTRITEAAAIAIRNRGVARRSRTVRRGALAALLVGVLAAAVLIGGRFAQPKETIRKSVAVLPFENRGSEQANAFLAEGVHDQVLTDLAKVAQLKVIGRTSVLQYKPGAPRNVREVAQQLGVAYVLEGSVQRAAGKVRVNARLSDANSDTQLWAESYERDAADVFTIQGEIAKAIAKQLEAKLSSAERAAIERKPTTDLTAFELYTRGRALLELAETTTELQDQSVFAAIDVLNQAVQRDPAFVAAYCDLAEAHNFLYWNGVDRSPARLASGRAAVDAALRLAPQSGDAHLALAAHLYATRELDRAQQQLTTARVTLPNNPRMFALSGYIHRRLGRWEESTRELEHAIEIDPRNANILQQLAANYHALHNYVAYVGTLERVIAIVPERTGPRLARAHAEVWWHANTEPLRSFIDDAIRQDPTRADEFVHNQIMIGFLDRDFARIERGLAALGDRWFGTDHAKFSRAFGEGMLARMMGDADAARVHFTAARAEQERVVQAQPNYAPATCVLALIDAALGRKEEALREGRRALELLPESKDSMAGPYMVWQFAIIASWVGENDLAIEQLRHILQQPAGPQYGHLKLDPMWDPLRSDPRFEEIVASLAPTDS